MLLKQLPAAASRSSCRYNPATTTRTSRNPVSSGQEAVLLGRCRESRALPSMSKRSICRAAAWLFCTMFAPFPANAHDLPLDRVMNAFVKIGSHEAHLVVRVPLDLLRGVPFPLSGDQYKIEASRAAVDTAVRGLASALQLWEGNVRLVPSSATGQLAPLSDRSFEDFDWAVAQVAEQLPPDTVIAFEQAIWTPISFTRSPRPNRCFRSSRRSALISETTPS